MSNAATENEDRVAAQHAGITEPRLLAFLLCDHANTTDDGKPNIIGVFDRLVVPKVPGPTANFFFYLRTAETIGGDLEIIHERPGGQVVKTMRIATPSPENEDERPVLMNGQGRMTLTVHEEGVHWFVVRFDNRELGRVPVNVVVGGIKQ